MASIQSGSEAKCPKRHGTFVVPSRDAFALWGAFLPRGTAVSCPKCQTVFELIRPTNPKPLDVLLTAVALVCVAFLAFWFLFVR